MAPVAHHDGSSNSPGLSARCEEDDGPSGDFARWHAKGWGEVAAALLGRPQLPIDFANDVLSDTVYDTSSIVACGDDA